MAIKDALKVSRKTYIDPATWIGYRSLKESNLSLWAILKNLFTRPKKEDIAEETFEQAMARLDLTEEAVQSAIKNYRSYAIMFLILGFSVFFYSFYLLFKSHLFGGWFLGMAASALFFVYAFKYDFWAFQMKRRQLGVTFEEWKRSVLGD